MEGSDVDAGLAQGGREAADETRLVEIGDVDHRRAELGVHADALDVDDARAAVGEHSAGDRTGLVFRHHRHGDQAVVIAGDFAGGFLDDDAALLGDDRRGDEIDVAEHRPQQTGQRRRGQRLDLHLGDLPLIGDRDFAEARFGELAGERAELLGQRDEGFQLRRFFGGDRREVDRVGNGAGQEIVRHLLGDLQRDILLRFRGRCAEMRRADDVGMAEQDVLGRRLLDEDVESGAGDVLGIQRIDQRLLVDQTAARTIDDAHALLGLGQSRRVDDVLGLVGQRRVQRDEVGALEEIVELDLLDADIPGALRRQERIERDHLHAQAERAIGDDRTDIAAADDAERLGGDLDAHEAVLLPLAGLRRSIGRRNFTRQRQHQGDRVFGGGDRIAERRVHHDDALGRRRRDFDIVDADAGAADHLEPCRFFENLGGRLGRRANGEAVVIADDLRKLVLVLAEVRLEIDVDAAILEYLDGGGRQGVGDENFGCGHDEGPVRFPSPSSSAKADDPALE